MKKLFIFIVASLFACSPQQRINRICKHHPNICVTTKDTLVDTIRIKELRVDTFFTLKQLIDTVYVNKDSMKVKIYLRHDSVFVDIFRKADTIYKLVPYEKTVIKIEKEKIFTKKILFYFGISLLVIVIVLAFIKLLNK